MEKISGHYVSGTLCYGLLSLYIWMCVEDPFHINYYASTNAYKFCAIPGDNVDL